MKSETRLTLLQYLEAMGAVNALTQLAPPIVSNAAPRTPSRPRIFKHVKGKRSASLHARSQRRKVSR